MFRETKIENYHKTFDSDDEKFDEPPNISEDIL